jgi:hypothetical protein
MKPNMSTMFLIHLPISVATLFGADQKCQMVASWDQKGKEKPSDGK